MTTKTMMFVAFMLGLLAFSWLGTRNGFGLPDAEKESVSVREGSTGPRDPIHRTGRFWRFRSGK